MTHGAAPDVGLADGADRQCRHHPRRHAEHFQCVLHGQRVHHRGQHAHVIPGCAFHSCGRAGHAAKNVAATDDQTGFDPGGDDLPHFAGYRGNHFRVNPVGLLSHQGLTGNLEEDSRIEMP